MWPVRRQAALVRRGGQPADRAAIPRASLRRLVRVILLVFRAGLPFDAHATAPGGIGYCGTPSKSTISPASVSVSATYALS